MKNNVLKMIEYLYYFSLIASIILYLFPGSLIGYFFYGDLEKQPNIVNNPIGTSINHLFCFMYLTFLAVICNIRDKSFNQILIFLISLSIISEITHYFVPNRSFQLLDLFANLLGTFIAIFMIIICKKYKKI